MNRLLWLPLLAGLGFLLPTNSVTAGEWGTIKGQVVYDAKAAPERQPINVTANQDHCLSKGPILSEELVVNPKNLGVRWAYVWLAPVTKGGPLPIHPTLQKSAKKQVEIDQPCCMFIPHCTALREDQELVIKNTSPIAHNSNYVGGPKNPGANPLIPAGQQVVVNNLQADRFPISLSCSIHPWMKGWIRVFDHPYYAVTDENGKFEIKNAPAGKYKLIYWHEKVGWIPDRNGIDIEIKAGGVTDAGQTKMKEQS